MSKTAQRKTTAIYLGKRLGEHIARNMGSTGTKLFNAIVRKDYPFKPDKIHYPCLHFRGAQLGYAEEMTRLAEKVESKSLLNKMIGG